MKKLLIFIVTICVSNVVLAQTQTKNYVKSTSYQKPVQNQTQIQALSADDKLENITYYDGLGRPEQNIAVRQGGTQKDIVTPIVYDAYGRQEKAYLPYAKVTNENFTPHDVLLPELDSYYTTTYPDDIVAGTPNAYSETHFEASPLNRVLEQGAPGEDWKVAHESDSDHTIKFDYQSNAASEVAYFKVNFLTGDTQQPQLLYDGFYNANELYKTITKDENWQPGQTNENDHTTEEFKNKQGQVVLKRTYDGGVPHDTHYVYDDYGNLTYVLSPKGSKNVLNAGNEVQTTVLDNLCYQYRYDYRNRLVAKKIPAKGWEYIIYDKLDRPVLTQDANLRETNQWLFTKYDAFDRVVYTGMYEAKDKDGNDLDRPTLIHTINTQSVINERKSHAVAITIGDTSLHHTNDVFPQINIEIYTVNYYDDYPMDIHTLFPNIGVFPLEGQDVEISSNTKTLATGSKVRVLGTSDWIISATYYDEKARPVYTGSKNAYLNTIDISKTALDFEGKVIANEMTHTKDGLEVKTLDLFTYDNANRVLTQVQKINNFEPELIVNNSYDELGQLIGKKVGGAVATIPETSTGLQDVNYKYNIRGWLTQINDVNNIGDDLFSFQLNYNTATLKLFNGNIAQTIWNTANDNIKRSYTYGYDALNRLKLAVMGKGQELSVVDNSYGVRRIRYDANGNIGFLIRRGHVNEAATDFGVMDRLKYLYTGNQLKRVTDISGNNFGFKDGNTQGDDYSYDLNGNMTEDKNKGVRIAYNHLNLPIQIRITNTDTDDTGVIYYKYDATGVKIEKSVDKANIAGAAFTYYAGNYIYTLGPHRGAQTTLEFFNHPEGYVEPTIINGKQGPFIQEIDYIYQYKDHLGNIRLSYSDANNDGHIANQNEIIEENNYYPFGLEHKGYNNIVSANSNSTASKFKYNGKELNDELGLDWYDLGARNHDPALGRFMNIDPRAEDYVFQSTYAFAANNPIFYVDINGEGVDDNYKINADGTILRQVTDDATDTFTYVDSDGGNHNIGTFAKNSNGLINSPNINYDSGDGTSVDITSKPGNESEINISGTALASVIGASADSGQEVYITRASASDGSSPGTSRTHVNGKNIDLRFVGENGARTPLDYSTTPSDFNKIDQTGSEKLNAGLNKFGYNFIGASKFTSNNKTVRTGISSSIQSQKTQSIKGSNNLKNHTNHLHLQGYRPRVKTRNLAVPVSTLSPAGVVRN